MTKERNEKVNSFLQMQAGRKFNMGLLFAFMVFVMYMVAPLAPVWSKIILETGGILATLYAIYNGGNVSNKYVTLKHSKQEVTDGDSQQQ